MQKWVSVFTGLDHWTGLLDWTTGLENHAQNHAHMLENTEYCTEHAVTRFVHARILSTVKRLVHAHVLSTEHAVTCLELRDHHGSG